MYLVEQGLTDCAFLGYGRITLAEPATAPGSSTSDWFR